MSPGQVPEQADLIGAARAAAAHDEGELAQVRRGRQPRFAGDVLGDRRLVGRGHWPQNLRHRWRCGKGVPGRIGAGGTDDAADATDNWGQTRFSAVGKSSLTPIIEHLKSSLTPN